jgi:rod shape determining protein RodA
LPLGWFFLKDYQRQRIVSFFNPHFDYQGASYHMIQSIISVGAGGFFGRGLGFGTQSKLNFLPESHTDFIFASLVEQFGFLGGFLILVLYGFLFYLLLKRSLFFLKQKDEQENFLVIMGVLAYFFFQMLINIGMNMGLFPITGIVLPFLSYGGSALISSFFLLGLIP